MNKTVDIIRFQDIPKPQRTYSLCLAAVRQNKLQLKLVPEIFKTAELLQSIPHYNRILKYIPYKLLSLILYSESLT
jgi:hypothetical protein